MENMNFAVTLSALQLKGLKEFFKPEEYKEIVLEVATQTLQDIKFASVYSNFIDLKKKYFFINDCLLSIEELNSSELVTIGNFYEEIEKPKMIRVIQNKLELLERFKESDYYFGGGRGGDFDLHPHIATLQAVMRDLPEEFHPESNLDELIYDCLLNDSRTLLKKGLNDEFYDNKIPYEHIHKSLTFGLFSLEDIEDGIGNVEDLLNEEKVGKSPSPEFKDKLARWFRNLRA